GLPYDRGGWLRALSRAHHPRHRLPRRGHAEEGRDPQENACREAALKEARRQPRPARDRQPLRAIGRFLLICVQEDPLWDAGALSRPLKWRAEDTNPRLRGGRSGLGNNSETRVLLIMASRRGDRRPLGSLAARDTIGLSERRSRRTRSPAERSTPGR